jgi:hypothetical protein
MRSGRVRGKLLTGLVGVATLAVAHLSGDSVAVLIGNGSGGFTPAAGSPIALGGGP